MSSSRTIGLLACHCCGLIHRVPPQDDPPQKHSQQPTQHLVCVRCQATLRRARSENRPDQRTAAASLAAFFLYIPAVTLPILQVERLGHQHVSSLLGGTWQLLREGSWFVGIVVLLFSIILPLAKILLLLELSLFELTHQRHRAVTYRLVEQIGKWGMMDVLLLALLVMLVKVGSLVEFHLGPATWAFVLCVLLSMIASWSFDPHSIWNESK